MQVGALVKHNSRHRLGCGIVIEVNDGTTGLYATLNSGEPVARIMWRVDPKHRLSRRKFYSREHYQHSLEVLSKC